MPRKEQMIAQDCVCHECDLLVAVPPLHEGEQALCPRCDHVLVHMAKALRCVEVLCNSFFNSACGNDEKYGVISLWCPVKMAYIRA